MFFDSAISSASNINASINSIPMLNGTNFKTWHENLQIVLDVMDLDLALRVSSPAPLTVESSSYKKRDIERWEKSNRMCLMIIKKCETPRKSNFLKNGKMVISVKIQNFSRSWMTKRTSTLESSREISLPRRILRQSEFSHFSRQLR